jgi:hypothetical protein
VVLCALGFLAVGLAVYAYLPLAANGPSPVIWGNPQNWAQFWWLVNGAAYRNLAFGLDVTAVPGRLAEWARLLGEQFGWWGLVLAVLGGWVFWQRDRRFALFAAVWTALLGVFAFFYDTQDAQVFLLPALLLLGLAWGAGVGALLRLAQRLPLGARRLAAGGLLALPLLSLVTNWQTADLSGDWSGHRYSEQVLAAVDPGGLVIVRGDKPTFALWYAVYAEGWRPDIVVVSGALLGFDWYRSQVRRLYPDLFLREPVGTDGEGETLVRDLILQNLGQRPIYASDPDPVWAAWFDLVPVGQVPIYRVEPRTTGRIGAPPV